MHRARSLTKPVHFLRAAVCVAGAAFALGAGLPTQAQAPAPASDGWSFGLTPYVWFAGLEGDVGAISGLPPVSVDAGFGDIIENTDFTFMLAAEARRGRFGVITDLSYLALSSDGDTPGALFSTAEVESTTFFATVAGAYRVWADDRIAVDGAVGARVWYVDTKIDLGAGLVAARSIEDDEVWADPVIGVRSRAELGRSFSLIGAADIGGFGLASDFTWQILGTLAYEVADWVSVRAGYRHLEVDYEDDGFVWDVELSGPLVGATFRF